LTLLPDGAIRPSLRFFELPRVLTESARAAERENAAVLGVFARQVPVTADRLPNPEGTEVEAEVANAALFAIHVANPGKIARVETTWTTTTVETNLNVAAAAEE
jgi:hypothetical protein